MSWIIENINKDVKNESEFEMQLHGMKLKVPGAGASDKMGDESLTEDQKEAMDVALIKAKERKTKEIQARNS